MKNEEDEKVKDIRREYLKSLLNDIFITTANSCEKRKDEKTSSNVTCVVRGDGKPIKDCSFLATGFKRYVKLFEATFTDKKCLFEYKGNYSNQKDFSRDIAIKKAVSFFKFNDIDINYIFHSQAEKYLFSRLIYRYIKQLLNVLFADTSFENMQELNEYIKDKYKKALAKIREEVYTVDIYELIYRNTYWSDAELTSYNGTNINECDSIILIEKSFDYEKARLVYDIDRCVHIRPSDRRSTYTYSEISYKSYEINMMNRLSIQYTNKDRFVPVEILELSDKGNKTIRLDKEKYIPRFVCIAFRKKDIEDGLIKAAERAVLAGYDGVQIHAAHGFFLSRYISPAHNHQTETPETLIIDIAKSIRANHPNLHITMKINSSDFMYGGLDEKSAMRVCIACAHYLDSIEVSGNGTSMGGIKAGVNEAYFKKFAIALAREVDIPVILVGGHRSIENMNAILNESDIEYFSMSRPLVREPELIDRWQGGDYSPAKCVSCNMCYRTPAHRCIFRLKGVE